LGIGSWRWPLALREISKSPTPTRRRFFESEWLEPKAAILMTHASNLRNLLSVFPNSGSRLILFLEKLLGSLPNFMIFRLYTLAAGLLVAAFAAYLVFGRKKKTPAEIERERRDWLNQIGRITDGTVIDVHEIVPPGHPAVTMLIFQYDVGGVSYEASQDVTYLRQWVNLHSCRLGLPTSVRYDPQSPGNSMVVSEKWMGLRQ
jgi:hypothetical protein